MHGRDQDSDRLIGEIARQLKRPVGVDPTLDARVMAELGRPAATSGRTRWLGAALAAGLIALAFYMGGSRGEPGANPGVSFSLEAPAASRVSLVGDFNNWDPSATPLERVSPAGRWEAVIPLTPGRYQFTYVIDGNHWVRDPGLPQATGDDFGQPTSVITVVNGGRS